MHKIYRNKRGNRVEVKPSGREWGYFVVERRKNGDYIYVYIIHRTEAEAQAVLDRRAVRYGWSEWKEESDADG